MTYHVNDIHSDITILADKAKLYRGTTAVSRAEWQNYLNETTRCQHTSNRKFRTVGCSMYVMSSFCETSVTVSGESTSISPSSHHVAMSPLPYKIDMNSGCDLINSSSTYNRETSQITKRSTLRFWCTVRQDASWSYRLRGTRREWSCYSGRVLRCE